MGLSEMAKPSYRGFERGAFYYAWKGQLWRLRKFADGDDSYWDQTTFDRGIRPFVGCLAAVEPPDFYEFPPAELIGRFPGYVGARYTSDFHVQYTAAPDVVVTGNFIASGEFSRMSAYAAGLHRVEIQQKGE